MTHNLFNTRQTFKTGDGADGVFYSLAAARKRRHRQDFASADLDPHRARIGFAKFRRRQKGQRRKRPRISRVGAPATSAPKKFRSSSRALFCRILRAFRCWSIWRRCVRRLQRMGKDVGVIEPLVPVDLVIDHSVQVDYAGSETAYQRNMEMEFKRNEQRYRFLKWGTQAFNGFSVVPPGIGIVHQVNLEYLAKGVFERDGVYFPDTLVGTDSHTTMINGLGIVGWGVGGIEAEAGMLGQPVYFLTPDVVGVHLTGELAAGRDRDRSRSANHGNASQGERRRQIRRIFRRRRGGAARDRPRDDRQYGARIRRDDGLFRRRTKKRSIIFANTGRDRRADRNDPKLLHGAGNVRNSAGRRGRLHDRSRS